MSFQILEAIANLQIRLRQKECSHSLPAQYVESVAIGRGGRMEYVPGSLYTTFKAKRKMLLTLTYCCIYGLCVEIKLPKFDT